MLGIVLADSNELIRIGLRTIIEGNDQIKITGEAASNGELLDLVKNFEPDVVLIDFTSEGFSIDVIPAALSVNESIKIVAITYQQKANTIIHALKSGVTGYIKKDCSLTEIMDAVSEAGKGNQFFCGQILDKIRKEAIEPNDIDKVDFNCTAVALSARELEIIELIAEGNTNVQIAESLFLSGHTVNTHRKNIMAKLGVKNTAGIVMYAVKTEIVTPNKFLFAGEA